MNTRTIITVATMGAFATVSATPIAAASSPTADSSSQALKVADQVSPSSFSFGDGVSSVTGKSKEAARVNSKTGNSISISLEGVPTNASSSQQGAEVYSSPSGYSAIVDSSGKTSRIRYVMNSKSSSKSISFKVSGGHPSLEKDGSVSIPLKNGERGIIKKPWAIDAKGDRVSTDYTVSGDTITQHVNASPQNSFPIVADPTFGIEHYFAPTMYLNKSETSKAQNATYVAWLCGVWGGSAGVLCGGNLTSIAVNAKRAVSHHKCARLLFSPGVIDTEEYTGGNCK